VKGNIQYEVRSNTSNVEVATSEKNLRKLEDKITLEIEQSMEKALKKLQQDFKADAVNFGELFRAKYPKLYRQHKKHWNSDIFPNIKVTYDLNVMVVDPGKRTLPTGWRPDEVQR